MNNQEEEFPRCDSLEELISFFDDKDLGDYLEWMPLVEFEVDLKSEH